jgi:CRISPR/Cas system CMR-associated protein Cmr5 small subunit
MIYEITLQLLYGDDVLEMPNGVIYYPDQKIYLNTKNIYSITGSTYLCHQRAICIVVNNILIPVAYYVEKIRELETQEDLNAYEEALEKAEEIGTKIFEEIVAIIKQEQK